MAWWSIFVALEHSKMIHIRTLMIEWWFWTPFRTALYYDSRISFELYLAYDRSTNAHIVRLHLPSKFSTLRWYAQRSWRQNNRSLLYLPAVIKTISIYFPRSHFNYEVVVLIQLQKLHIKQHIQHNNTKSQVDGVAPTGDVPTTSEWSASSLPTKVRHILQVWRCIP